MNIVHLSQRGCNVNIPIVVGIVDGGGRVGVVGWRGTGDRVVGVGCVGKEERVVGIGVVEGLEKMMVIMASSMPIHE